MSDENIALGGNARAELKRRIERRLEKMDEGDEVKAEIAEFKREDKSDGFTEKVIGQVIKEKRKGPQFILAQHTLEAELQAYRDANGLPTTLEQAQAHAAKEANNVPEPKTKKKNKGRQH